MISEIYKRGSRENSEAPLDPQQDSITLHIADLHGEYVLPSNPPGGYSRVYCIIDYFRLEQLMGEGPTDDYLNAAMPQKLQDVFGSAQVDVWELFGTYDQLQWVFLEFLNKIFDHETGGDDDIFDYWRSAMTVAWQLANDLDEAYKSGENVDHLKVRYAEYIDKFGEVMEYTPDWEGE
jgi:hypothetical protein